MQFLKEKKKNQGEWLVCRVVEDNRYCRVQVKRDRSRRERISEIEQIFRKGNGVGNLER